jgi:hypothetical protein
MPSGSPDEDMNWFDDDFSFWREGEIEGLSGAIKG